MVAAGCCEKRLRTLPLDAGVYGVEVRRGPDWEFLNQDFGLPGRSLKPTTIVLRMWLWGGLTGACGGQRDPLTGVYDGGRWPDRYAYVEWADGMEAFYRAGHDGC